MRERRCQRWPRKATSQAALRRSGVLPVGGTPEGLRPSSLASRRGGST